MPIRILDGDIHLIDLETRLPFKYGIATMTSAPHAFVRIRVEIDGRETSGIAADHLPPKWFTKVPDKALDVEIEEMLDVIQHAVSVARGIEGECAFDIWQQLHTLQKEWGAMQGLPPLLSNFGTTLVERGLIEATCRSAGSPFHDCVVDNIFGIRLSNFDPRLAGDSPSDLLPQHARETITARHTVGMADPLTDDDILAHELLDDGLPQSLADCMRQYGLRHLKIKLSGDCGKDSDRLSTIARIVEQQGTTDIAFTLDGNEYFRTLEGFKEFWRTLSNVKKVRTILERLLFVEQPFHRDVALSHEVLGEMRYWDERPRMIIDESDAELHSLPRALELGYHGTSHKNCKGIFKGIANACLLEKLRRDTNSSDFVMSGEDLANIGPVALLQDLAVAATLGVESVERNGHHYFAGLSAFPDRVQRQVALDHGDLYQASNQGWPTLSIRDGSLTLRSINAAYFGVGFVLDVEQFVEINHYRQGRK